MRFSAPLVVVLAALCGAADGCFEVCEDADDPSCDDGGEGEDEPPSECDDFGCVTATPGCNASDIRQVRAPDNTVVEVCASCAFDDAEGEICGAPEIAQCESREAASGGLCHVCATDFGEVLYQDCYEQGAEVAVICEPFIDDLNGQFCSVCMAEDGRVVERQCEQELQECVEIEVDGQLCVECVRGSDVVVVSCEQPRIAPNTCERYGNDQIGFCIDCYDDATLLSHTCTPPGGVACFADITVEGLFCERCTDGRDTCGAAPQALQCQEMVFSDQVCVVCIDEANNLAKSQCDVVCPDPNACEPQPCFFEQTVDGEICRTCGEETQCVSRSSSLFCGTEPGFSNPNGGSDSCTVCHDAPTGVEVYRDCNNNGPAVCGTADDFDGTACEICYDPEDGSAQYTTCGDRVCYDVGSRQLTSQSGQVLLMDGSVAVASCGACRDEQDAVFETSCQLRNDCPNGENGITDPAVVCPDSVVFTLIPNLCANPWELGGYAATAGTVDEILAIMAFALETSELGVVSVDHQGVLGNSTCVDDCSCARGDIIRVEVRGNQDAFRAQQRFADVIAHCADFGCEAGGECRQDGSCNY